MAARIVVDAGVADSKMPAIVEAVKAGLRGLAELDSVLAVVTRLPSGRLTLFINHIEDPGLLANIEAELAKLR